MKVLGAILAGGKAQRFGSDKAHAVKDGKRLIDWVAEALTAQCDEMVVCGRKEAGFTCIPDQPIPDLGPLGGLCAALNHAQFHGYSHVLSVGVDVPNLPHDLIAKLDGQGAAIVDNQPVVGLWPSGLGHDLKGFLADNRRALYGFAEVVEARHITLEPPLMNVNHPKDL